MNERNYETGELIATLISSLGFVLLIGLFIVSALRESQGRDFGQYANEPPEIRAWALAQLVPGGPDKGKSCCSTADGTRVQEEIRNSVYWVTFEAAGRVVGPMPVPEEAVLNEPNKKGVPWVWYYFDNGITKIRCYAPGPKS